ncbi:MAG TPA: MFS transporter [Clostridia bacterium]|nr:MFS transporter [Clostridia bacterium]
MTAAERAAPGEQSALEVFRNPAFVRLWLAQALTQVGGNMVLFALLLIVRDATGSNTAVAILILTFLVPAVLLSAVAGVYVDRLDRRLILVATNLVRGILFIALYFVGDNYLLILLLNTFVSIVNVFFSPAEAAMIPVVVPRQLLIAANGIFIITLNAAFALGFALLGPLVVNIASAEEVILVVAVLFFAATVLCVALPPSPPKVSRKPAGAAEGPLAMMEAERAVESTFSQLREGITFIRGHRAISWSLLYLVIASSLLGVLGVLGPDFAETTLGLEAKDLAVVVLPMGFGIVLGILLLNAYGRYAPRRRVIEGGLVALGLLLLVLSVAGPISQILSQAEAASGLVDLSSITSLLAVVIVIAFFAGIAYGCVAIPAQTQLQEDIPADVRGRVFGVLNMLVSVSSFLPIIVVGPLSDLIGTTAVIVSLAIGIVIAGIASIIRRGPLRPDEAQQHADSHAVDPIAAALGADRPSWSELEPGSAPTRRATRDSPSGFGGDEPDRD